MIEEYLQSIGYNDEQILSIRKTFPSFKYSEATILYNFKNMYQYFKKNGIEGEEFIKITMITPNIIMESIENIKNRIQELISLGFRKTDVFQMIQSYPYILGIHTSQIQSKLEDLMKLSFSKNAVITIVSKYPLDRKSVV